MAFTSIVDLAQRNRRNREVWEIMASLNESDYIPTEVDVIVVGGTSTIVRLLTFQEEQQAV